MCHVTNYHKYNVYVFDLGPSQMLHQIFLIIGGWMDGWICGVYVGGCWVDPNQLLLAMNEGFAAQCVYTCFRGFDLFLQ